LCGVFHDERSNRLRFIQDIVDRRLTIHLDAERLGISDRHCRRLLQRYRTDNPLGMADRRRGKPCNYQLPASLALQIHPGDSDLQLHSI